VQVFAFVCAGAVHEALHDSPTGSITLVITKRNTYLYCTASPLLFGENPNAAHKYQEEFLAPLPGRHHQNLPSTYTQTIIYLHLLLLAICLSFSSPPLLKQFYKKHKNILFACLLASLLLLPS
jgi:hypothetical protein